MFARREWERDDCARSLNSALRVLLCRAAHPMQRRPDGTKHLRHVQLHDSVVTVGPSVRVFELLRNVVASTEGTRTFGCV